MKFQRGDVVMLNKTNLRALKTRTHPSWEIFRDNSRYFTIVKKTVSVDVTVQFKSGDIANISEYYLTHASGIASIKWRHKL